MLSACSQDQSPIDPDISAGYGEGVNRIVAHDEEAVIAHAIVDAGQQAKTDVIDIPVQQRLGFDQISLEQTFINRFTELLFALDIDRRILTQAG